MCKALIATVARRPRERAPYIAGKTRARYHALWNQYGTEAIMAALPRAPIDALVPNVVSWLRDELAPDLVLEDAPTTPEYDRVAALERERMGLRSKIDVYRAAGESDDGDALRDLLSRLETCETELATTTGGTPQ